MFEETEIQLDYQFSIVIFSKRGVDLFHGGILFPDFGILHRNFKFVKKVLILWIKLYNQSNIFVIVTTAILITTLFNRLLFNCPAF